jgi:putative acetyltransferase
MSAALVVALESPRQTDVVALIAALDAYVSALYPVESNHLLGVDALAVPSVRFFVARRNGEALGCGALLIDADGSGELKRMYVRPQARGQRIGRALLARIEEEARGLGLAWVRLETGIEQPEALGLYRASGYAERGPFGEYVPDRLSVFMEKSLR